MTRQKRSMVWVITAALCFLLPAASGVAGEQETQGDASAEMKEWMELLSPGEHHAKLESLVGSWDCEVRMWESPEQDPLINKGSAEFSWILGGRYLQQDFEGSFIAMPFTGLGFTGYDNVAGHYVSVWMDDLGTGIMTETGSANEAGTVFKSQGSFYDPNTGELAHTRSVHKVVDQDQHLVVMYRLVDGEEIKMMEIVYSRAQG